MKQVKTSMCTTMCCSMMNMSMYMHSMCKTQHSALKENSNKHRINKVINRKLLYQCWYCIAKSARSIVNMASPFS